MDFQNWYLFQNVLKQLLQNYSQTVFFNSFLNLKPNIMPKNKLSKYPTIYNAFITVLLAKAPKK